MDETDQKLLSLLRQDARLTVAALAAKLKVSRGTVTNRIRRLEDDGVIVGYTVRLRPDVQHNTIKAWMSIAVEGNQTRAVIASLLGEPGVATLHDTNGRWDLLAELRAESLQELAKVLERIRLLKGISPCPCVCCACCVCRALGLCHCDRGYGARHSAHAPNFLAQSKRVGRRHHSDRSTYPTFVGAFGAHTGIPAVGKPL